MAEESTPKRWWCHIGKKPHAARKMRTITTLLTAMDVIVNMPLLSMGISR
jgi:hypothetical protein